MAAEVDTDKCTGCGLCVEACPVEAITLENDKAKVDDDTCVDCGACAGECPNDAISLIRYNHEPKRQSLREIGRSL